MHSPVPYLLFALALSGCASSRVKTPIRISERITLVEGYKGGTLSYVEDEMKRLYFDNGRGSQVYLMKIVQDGKTIQECDEPEYKEGLTGGGVGWVSAGPGKPMIYTGGGKQEVEIKPVHSIRCILKQYPDLVEVELMDPEGLYSRYQVILKD